MQKKEPESLTAAMKDSALSPVSLLMSITALILAVSVGLKFGR